MYRIKFRPRGKTKVVKDINWKLITEEHYEIVDKLKELFEERYNLERNYTLNLKRKVEYSPEYILLQQKIDKYILELPNKDVEREIEQDEQIVIVERGRFLIGQYDGYFYLNIYLKNGETKTWNLTTKEPEVTFLGSR